MNHGSVVDHRGVVGSGVVDSVDSVVDSVDSVGDNTVSTVKPVGGWKYVKLMIGDDNRCGKDDKTIKLGLYETTMPM